MTDLPGTDAPQPRTRIVFIATILFIAVCCLYAQVRSFQFVDFDDGEYVYDNPHVVKGLTPGEVVWSLTNAYSANWHPLTWISHMIDVQLFGMNAGAHHAENALIHALNAVALFLLLQAALKRTYLSLFIALAFGIHPLNVESVAWVSQRKTVLSTLLMFATIAAYGAWTKNRSRQRYTVLTVLFVLGLCAKSMLVTLPALLLLLDLWPLRRIQLPSTMRDLATWPRSAWPLCLEKIPLFIIATAAAVVTWVAQSSWNAAGTATTFPLRDRILNAFTSYVWYIEKCFWPSSLSMFYPHPRTLGSSVDIVVGALSGTAVLGASIAAVRLGSKRPYVFAGWFWYIIALVPVIGLVQVGSQAHADRYAYVPLIGLITGVVIATAEILNRSSKVTLGASVTAVIAIAVLLGAAAYRQIGYWRDRPTLYTHAIAVSSSNWMASNNLGMYRLEQSDYAAAFSEFRRATIINKSYADAYYNAGIALAKAGRPGESIVYYRRAIELEPANADAWVNLGLVHLDVGQPMESIRCLTHAVEIRENDPIAMYGLSIAYASIGDRARAFTSYNRLKESSPDLAARALQAFTRPQ